MTPETARAHRDLELEAIDTRFESLERRLRWSTMVLKEGNKGFVKALAEEMSQLCSAPKPRVASSPTGRSVSVLFAGVERYSVRADIDRGFQKSFVLGLSKSKVKLDVVMVENPL